jgi:hypothetical protein
MGLLKAIGPPGSLGFLLAFIAASLSGPAARGGRGMAPPPFSAATSSWPGRQSPERS